MRIAIDFDGTIVENRYPKIGAPMLFSFETMKALKDKGHQLILWTYRNGKELDEAVAYCRNCGIEFYSVNHSHPEEALHYSKNIMDDISRKVDADIFIDDRNVGGFLGWSKVWQTIHPESGDLDLQYVNKEAHFNFKKSSFFSKFFGK